MKIPCQAHEKTTAHNLTAHEMAEILEKVQDGDAQTVTRQGVQTKCLLEV